MPSKNFITTASNDYDLYKTDLEIMGKLNEDYTIINPNNNTPSIPLSHKCLTADNASNNTKGTISFEPMPRGGYDFGYLKKEILSTITIRPKSNLDTNTKYTITINNNTDDSAFCRPLEKIVMSECLHEPIK